MILDDTHYPIEDSLLLGRKSITFERKKSKFE